MFLPMVWHTPLQHIANPRSNSNKYRSTRHLTTFRIHTLYFPLGFHTNPRFHTRESIKSNHNFVINMPNSTRVSWKPYIFNQSQLKPNFINLTQISNCHHTSKIFTLTKVQLQNPRIPFSQSQQSLNK